MTRSVVIAQVDAFTRVPFCGNPAGVVLNAEGLSEPEMRKIAAEMNVAETVIQSIDIIEGVKYQFEKVDYSNKINDPNLLEAEFVIQSNDQFHKISEKIKEETGNLDSKKIFFEWNEWLKHHVKKMDFHKSF